MDKRSDDYVVQVDDVIVEEADPQPSNDVAKVDDVVADAEIKDRKMRIPSKFDEIVRDPAPPVNNQLYDGVLLNSENKMLYWVEQKTNKNCFMLFVADLYIINDESRYWEREKQPLIQGKTDRYIEIARLIKVCWLEFGGSFDVSKLSSKTWYVVLFEVKLNEKVDEWTRWTIVKLTLQQYMNTRVKHEHKVNMKGQEKGKWVEIPFGVFNTSIITKGKIDFAFNQTGDWISGIEVRGVKIQPLEDS